MKKGMLICSAAVLMSMTLIMANAEEVSFTEEAVLTDAGSEGIVLESEVMEEAPCSEEAAAIAMGENEEEEASDPWDGLIEEYSQEETVPAAQNSEAAAFASAAELSLGTVYTVSDINGKYYTLTIPETGSYEIKFKFPETSSPSVWVFDKYGALLDRDFEDFSFGAEKYTQLYFYFGFDGGSNPYTFTISKKP